MDHANCFPRRDPANSKRGNFYSTCPPYRPDNSDVELLLSLSNPVAETGRETIVKIMPSSGTLGPVSMKNIFPFFEFGGTRTTLVFELVDPMDQ